VNQKVCGHFHLCISAVSQVLTCLILYSGQMGPNEDAPDIVANTFLAEITQQELDEVRKAFLMHRECKS